MPINIEVITYRDGNAAELVALGNVVFTTATELLFLRQPLVHERSCPQCGRSIRGNSYYSHVKRCQGAVPQLAGGELGAAVPGQQSLSSNV